MNNKREFRIGIIADTQYSDSDDGTTFDNTSVRRYRHSLIILETSIKFFNDNKVDYCVQLGDVLDSRTNRLNIADRCLQEVLTITDASNHPWSFCVGNHDLESISRDDFYSKLIPKSVQSICGPNKLYYDITPCSGFRFIFLDGFDISSFSATSDEHTTHAHTLLSSKNKNLAAGNHDWFVDLSVEDMKYVPYNGGLGVVQFTWLSDTLHQAKANRERCIIFTHMPIYSGCCRPSGIMWNSDEVMDLMHSPSLAGVVVAVIAGHDHDGGYAIDSHGIHHLVPPAPLECEVGQNAFGYISLHTTDNSTDNGMVDPVGSDENTSAIEEHMELHWVGRLPVSDPDNWPTVMQYPAWK